jgi:hypothetical protein
VERQGAAPAPGSGAGYRDTALALPRGVRRGELGRGEPRNA